MGIFKRISLIIRSNINALIDKAEDPEKMLDQIIADMNENMREIKLQIARSIKDEKLLERKVEENKKLCADYENKAMIALEKNGDDLAREALKRKKSYEEITRSLENELEEQRKAVDLLKKSYKALELKLQEAKNKRQILLARQKRAETTIDLSDTVNSINDQAELLEAFDRMADNVAKTEAMAGALAELDKETLEEQFEQLEQDRAIEDDLKALKEKIKK